MVKKSKGYVLLTVDTLMSKIGDSWRKDEIHHQSPVLQRLLLGDRSYCHVC